MTTTTENQSESVSTRKRPLLSLTLKEFEERMLSQMGEPPYRARQVWEWIFAKGVLEFEKMNNVPMPLRERLAATSIGRSTFYRRLQKLRGGDPIPAPMDPG